MSVDNSSRFHGRLGGDPEPLGNGGCKFSLAVDGWDGQAKAKTTIWVPIVAFGKSGERARQYLRKGSEVVIEAQYRTREYTDSNGNKRHDHSFWLDDFSFAGPPAAGAAASSNDQSTSGW